MVTIPLKSSAEADLQVDRVEARCAVDELLAQAAADVVEGGPRDALGSFVPDLGGAEDPVDGRDRGGQVDAARGLGHGVESGPAAGPARREVGRTPLDLTEQVHGGLGEDLLADRHQQLVEPGDVVEDRPPRDPRTRGDLLDGEPVGAVLGRERPGGLEDGVAPFLAQRAAAVGGRGAGHPAIVALSANRVRITGVRREMTNGTAPCEGRAGGGRVRGP